MVEADLERAEERAETGESYVYFLLFIKRVVVVVVFAQINSFFLMIKFSDFHGFSFKINKKI